VSSLVAGGDSAIEAANEVVLITLRRPLARFGKATAAIGWGFESVRAALLIPYRMEKVTPFDVWKNLRGLVRLREWSLSRNREDPRLGI